jgi:hypothetical protein
MGLSKCQIDQDSLGVGAAARLYGIPPTKPCCGIGTELDSVAGIVDLLGRMVVAGWRRKRSAKVYVAFPYNL